METWRHFKRMRWKVVNDGNTDVLWDRRSQLWRRIRGRTGIPSGCSSYLSDVTVDGTTEGGNRSRRRRACVRACVYKSQVPPVPADGARAGLSQESSVCVRETEGVRVCARSSGCQRSWTKTGRYFWGRSTSGESNLKRFGEKRRSVNATAAGLNLKCILTADFTVRAG